MGSEDDFVAVKAIFDALASVLTYYFLPDVVIKEGTKEARFSLATLLEEGQSFVDLLY